MFYTQKHKDQVQVLEEKVEALRHDIASLVKVANSHQKLLHQFVNNYPHGVKMDGEPRKKPGRKSIQK